MECSIYVVQKNVRKTIIESDIENLKACIDALINYKIEKEVF